MKKIRTIIFLIAYIVLGLLSELPDISLLGMNLAYIVIAFMCVRCTQAETISIAALGSIIVSLVATGWFPVGGLIAAVGVAFICAAGIRQETPVCPGNVLVCLLTALVVCGCVRTGFENKFFGKPYFMTVYKNVVSAGQNAAMLIIGLYAAKFFNRYKVRERGKSYERE